MKRKYQCIECGLKMEETTLSYNGNNPNKDYIMYDVVVWRYNIVSKNKKDFIEREFWETTTLWKVHPYSDELWKKLNKPSFCLISIIKKFINKIMKKYNYNKSK